MAVRSTACVLDLVSTVLDVLPQPYGAHIIDEVFVAIEGRPEWMDEYRRCALQLGSAQRVNIAVGTWVKNLLRFPTVRQVRDGKNGLSPSYSVLLPAVRSKQPDFTSPGVQNDERKHSGGRKHPDRYDYRACQSLFGYAQRAHRRSQARCQLCGCGDPTNFDFWRQLTVEHLIGQAQVGHIKRFLPLLQRRFPHLSAREIQGLAVAIDDLNTVSACGFCNSMTSQIRAPNGLDELIAAAVDPAQLLESVRIVCEAMLQRKKDSVLWKLEAVRAAWESGKHF